MDKAINKFRRDLLTLCITYSLLIVNCRCGDDKNIGNFTYVSVVSNSIIDYVVCSKDLIEDMNYFNVEQRTESPHFPLSFMIEAKELVYVNEPNSGTVDYENKMMYNFNSESVDEFRNSLLALLTDSKVQYMNNRIDNDNININDILKDFQDIVRTSSSGCLKRKLFSKCNQPKWFYKECKLLQSEKYKLLKQYRRINNRMTLICT